MKFATGDTAYLAKRRSISEQSGPREMWSLIDHWPLYCGVANLARFVAVTELLRSTLDVPGHIAEFGTWRGANLLLITKLLRIFDPHSMKLVHAFDSFQGLSEFSDENGRATSKRGAYKASLDELRQMMDLYELQDDIKLHIGVIEDTLPQLLESEKALSFSFVYCDTDLYRSTRCILENIHPRLMKGGIFAFDQWNWDAYPGEGMAVNEFLDRHAGRYAVEHVKGARQPTLCLRKLS